MALIYPLPDLQLAPSGLLCSTGPRALNHPLPDSLNDSLTLWGAQLPDSLTSWGQLVPSSWGLLSGCRQLKVTLTKAQDLVTSMMTMGQEKPCMEHWDVSQVTAELHVLYNQT